MFLLRSPRENRAEDRPTGTLIRPSRGDLPRWGDLPRCGAGPAGMTTGRRHAGGLGGRSAPALSTALRSFVYMYGPAEGSNTHVIYTLQSALC